MRFSPSYPVQLLFLFLLCPFLSQAQHSFISFYPDTTCYSLAATVDAKGEFDGEYISFWKNGTVMDSGSYVHGMKTGYWLSRDPKGVFELQEWYNGKDSIAIRARTYNDQGLLTNSIERVQDAAGEIRYMQHFDDKGRLKEDRVAYAPARNGISARSKHFAGHNDLQTGARYMISVKFANGTGIDSMYDEQGTLRDVRTEDHEWQFYADGSRSSYSARDTECTWFDNGQLFSFSVSYKPGRVFTAANQDGSILPSACNSYRTRDGFLLQENYSFPVYLPPLTQTHLCNENGKVYGEGMTDAKGLKDGYWHYYAYQPNGDQYTAMEGAYAHGCREGNWRSWYANGKLKSAITYRAYSRKVFRQMLYRSKAPRGECDKVIVEKNHRKKMRVRVNVISGPMIIYYPNGTKRMEAETDEKGVFTGTWSLYDSTGQLTSRRYYSHGLFRDSCWWTYPSGNRCRVMYFDSLGMVKKTVTFDPEKNGQVLSAAAASKIDIPYDPLWLYVSHLDGLGTGYIDTEQKGRAEYKDTRLYRKRYQSKKRIEMDAPPSPWVKGM